MISPGPWKLNKYGIEDANGEQVCEFFGPGEEHDPDIIRAAPELYTALVGVMAYAEPLNPEQEKAHKTARALLEKLDEQMGKQAQA